MAEYKQEEFDLKESEPDTRKESLHPAPCKGCRAGKKLQQQCANCVQKVFPLLIDKKV